MITYTLSDRIELSQTAVALGYFDGVHLGHRAVIQEAVRCKNKGLVPCAFTFTAKKERPQSKSDSTTIFSEWEKCQELERLGVEAVILPDFSEFKDLSAEEFLFDVLKERFHAKVICCGHDFHFGKGASGTADSLKQMGAAVGIEVIKVDAVLYQGQPISSTRIRAAIRQGEMEQVSAMLGRPYGIDSVVVEGNRLGRMMDFPTINQQIPDGFVVPRYGVYITATGIDGIYYPSVTNVGVKPTVVPHEEKNKPTFETYILGIDKDLYHQEINVRFLSFIREEKKFGDISELKKQIALDIAMSKERASTFCREININK